MPQKHQLFLELPYTSNVRVLPIQDTSLYSADLQVDCGVLQITPPGYSSAVDIEVDPSFNKVLDACALGLQTVDCGDSARPLPDGIYVVRYSVSPNDKVYVEYNHLRTTGVMNQYYRAVAKLELAACEPAAETKEKLRDLQFIKGLIEAAKIMVEYKHQVREGIELLEFAQKKLSRFC